MDAASGRCCPVCSTPLQPWSHEHVHLDRCPRGCGVWLDAGELREVVMSELDDRPETEEIAARRAAAAGVAEVVRDAQRAARSCPVCGAAMAVREYPGSGVALDECSDHGIWLDEGELERIEAYGEAMRAQASEGAAADAERSARSGLGAVRGIPIPPGVLEAARSSLSGGRPAG